MVSRRKLFYAVKNDGMGSGDDMAKTATGCTSTRRIIKYSGNLGAKLSLGVRTLVRRVGEREIRWFTIANPLER